MSKIKLSNDFIRNTVKLALNEDLYPSGDITSNLVTNNKRIKVKLLSNQEAIIGGLLFAKHAFNLVDNKTFPLGSTMALIPLFETLIIYLLNSFALNID